MINTLQTTTEPETTAKPERRGEVDLMRALMVLGLILFHTARIFDLLPFLVKNNELSLGFTVFVGFVSQWGMPLFFLIAGIAAWHSLSSRTAGQYAGERFRRLIIPFIFGMFVLVPPQLYYQLRGNPDYQDSYWQFYPDFFRVVVEFRFPLFIRADPAVGIFDTAHLWFLYYLFVFSMIALPLFVYLRRGGGKRLISRLAAFCEHPGAIFLLALPIIVIETFILTEETTGWNRYVYIPFLIYGYLLAADHRFEQACCTHRYIALVAGILAIMAFFITSVLTWQAGADPTRSYGLESITWRLLKSCSSWLWIVAILGWAHRYKQRQTRRRRRDSSQGNHHGGSKIVDKVRRYANEAVLPFYIIHQTVIVVIGFYVVKWEAGVIWKYLTITMATFVITLLLYEVIRRTNPTRFLFGMKPIESERRPGMNEGLRLQAVKRS